MPDISHDQRPRASLRGKGHAILLGQQAPVPAEDAPEPPRTAQAAPSPSGALDAAALSLTPEETGLLLDFSATSPAYQAQLEFDLDAPLPDQSVGVVASETEPLSTAAWMPIEEDGDTARVDEQWVFDVNVPDADQPEVQDDNWPVESSTLDVEGDRDNTSEAPDVAHIGDGASVGDYEAAPDEAAYQSDATGTDAGRSRPVPVPGSALEVLPSSLPADADLLTQLVDDERLDRLWNYIDKLQEEVIQAVSHDRSLTESYQRALLQASSMLVESRANFDEARAIVYRVRSDLNRRRKVAADTIRYRPLLLNYYLGWGIAWIVLMALKGLFVGVAESIGANIVGVLYYPTMFGVAGALIAGYVALDRHTTRLRDFDPIHISWYLFNPLLGGVMGLFTFLLVSVANEDLLQDTARTAELAIAWLLCMVAGMNQNAVLGRLSTLWKRGTGRD